MKKKLKEDIDRVRGIEGFPIASDEDIISLSLPPNYTACPNPYINEFIEKYGHEYNEKEDDYRVSPYTEDVSEGKHDGIYNVHSYHTKVPPKAIMTYLNHYTKPGDLVLDTFSGSGMTGIAAQQCNTGKRNAILLDLSPYATFLSSNYNAPISSNVVSEIENILDKAEHKYSTIYQTNHVINGEIQYGIHGEPIKGNVDYTIWSDVFFCPNCGQEMVFYDDALDPMTRKTLKKFKCINCNCELSKANILLKKKKDIDENGDIYEYVQKVPVLINYSIGNTRYLKVPDEEDLKQLDELEINNWIPNDELPIGYNTEQPKRSHGMCRVNSFYTKRTQLLISDIFEEFNNDNKKMFLFTSVLPKLTLLNRYMPEYDDKAHKFRALVGPMAGTYYVPALSVEHNVIKQLRFQLKKFQYLNYDRGNVIVSTQSATDLRNIKDNSIDYIFIDPPFGANIMYSELNFMPESWLKVKTSNTDEAIINNIQKKELIEYVNLMTKSFTELFRVLKPNRWLTIEFHNSKNAVWNGIQQSIQEAGFVIADVRTINKKKKTVMQFKSENTVDMDLAISVYKPKEKLKSTLLENAGTEETAWTFVSQHLEKLPVVVESKEGRILEIVQERQAVLLFDRMVAYHIMNGIQVPLDAVDFYRGLNERYVKRDEMYFLSDQINEYDTARIVNDIETIQMELFVTNEKSAIAWLYRLLDIPQTYAEIQPLFMQEIRSVDKYEEMPELGVLLEENFIQDEKSRWYIADINKEADIVKLRKKKLLKEFEGYLSSNGKLKQFRLEAIKAGFAKLWEDANYKLIVETAERLPESVVQEDDKLLMYYDISLGRI